MYMQDNIIHIIHLKITCSHVHLYTKIQLKSKAIHRLSTAYPPDGPLLISPSRGGSVRCKGKEYARREILSQLLQCSANTAEGFLFAQYISDVPDMWTTCSTYQTDTESIHHDSYTILLLGNPRHHKIIQALG